tara:strand:- start:40 stop:645 length:606 start_codon:yes stop_codon:yes gene_type:complete
VDAPVNREVTGSGALGYFYFNGTDQYATVETAQTVEKWGYFSTFTIPPRGKVNYIADSASHNAIYVTSTGTVKVEYAAASDGSLVSLETAALAVGSYNSVQVIHFLGALIIVVNNGTSIFGADAADAQSPFTRFGRKNGSSSSYFTGRIYNFVVQKLVDDVLVAENNYNFNEGSGTTFIDTVGSADATIANLGSAGGGWDY